MRIEAAQRSGGFTSAPTIIFEFARSEIAFLMVGKPPFVLAAGQDGGTDTYLPLASMLTQAPNGQRATATTPIPHVTLRLGSVGDASLRQQVLLWTILLVATGMLAMMAFLLWRRMSSD